jgi:hypothetical protein
MGAGGLQNSLNPGIFNRSLAALGLKFTGPNANFLVDTVLDTPGELIRRTLGI